MDRIAHVMKGELTDGIIYKIKDESIDRIADRTVYKEIKFKAD